MKDTQFKNLIKEALTPSFLKESVNEDSNKHSEWIYPIYFDMNNEYPVDAIARVAQGGDVEDIKDTFETIVNDFEFDGVDLANDIVGALMDSGFENWNLVEEALEDYLDIKTFEGQKKIEEDRFEDVEHMFSGEEKKKIPVLVDVWYSHHEEHGTGGVYKVIVHFDDESEETFYSLEDAEAKYDLEGVEREETEFDVS